MKYDCSYNNPVACPSGLPVDGGSKVRDAFNDPTWLKLEEEKPFDFNFDMKSFYAQLDVENSEYNYGHEVGKYHSDD